MFFERFFGLEDGVSDKDGRERGERTFTEMVG